MYIINDPSPNAFATGRDPSHAAVTVTTGLLQMMNREELEGVLAHEMSHIKNFDVRLLLVVTTMIGLAALIASMYWNGAWSIRSRDDRAVLVVFAIGIIFTLIAFLVGPLMQLALSRQRESLADVSGVELTRNPAGLISALQEDRPERQADGEVQSRGGGDDDRQPHRAPRQSLQPPFRHASADRGADRGPGEDRQRPADLGRCSTGNRRPTCGRRRCRPFWRRSSMSRRTELNRTLQVSGFAIVLGWAMYTAFNASQSIFLNKAGPQAYPLFFIILAVAVWPMVALQGAVTRRFGVGRAFRITLVANAVAAVGVYIAYAVREDATVAFAAYVVYSVAFELVMLHFWTFVSQHFNLLEGKRVFPVIAAGSSIGYILAGLTTTLVAVYATEPLIFVWSFGSAVPAMMSIGLERTLFRPAFVDEVDEFLADHEAERSRHGMIAALKGALQLRDPQPPRARPRSARLSSCRWRAASATTWWRWCSSGRPTTTSRRSRSSSATHGSPATWCSWRSALS